MEPMKATSVNSRAEELFVQLFCEAFGPEKTENLQVQYPCVDTTLARCPKTSMPMTS